MNTVSRFVEAFAPKKQPGLTVRNYGVTNVVPGASRDSKAQVYILVGTDSLAVPYLDSYLTPTVGDMVQVLFVNGSPCIQGRVIGLPTF